MAVLVTRGLALCLGEEDRSWAVPRWDTSGIGDLTAVAFPFRFNLSAQFQGKEVEFISHCLSEKPRTS